MVQKTISLDVWKSSMDFIRVIKGEADTRVLNLRLMNGENPVDLSGKTAALYYTKPDGTEEFIAAQISSDTAQEGYAAITLTSQACAAAGMITDAEIRIIGEGGSNLRAKMPRIYIAPSALDDAIVSSSEFQALDVALDLARSSTEAANTAAAKAETNATKAEDAAAGAEEQAASAATAAQSANAERLQSAAQTTLCEQATEQCNTAINRANTAAESCEELSENLSTLIAQETREVIDGEKAQPSGLATLDASGKVVQNPASTGVANGIATLDADGRLTAAQTAITTGSNANGTWIRFPDGTQICTKIITISMKIETADGSMYYGTRTSLGDFAMPFTEAPVESLLLTTGPSAFLDVARDITATSAGSVNLYKSLKMPTVGDYPIHVIAIGKWK